MLDRSLDFAEPLLQEPFSRSIRCSDSVFILLSLLIGVNLVMWQQLPCIRCMHGPDLAAHGASIRMAQEYVQPVRSRQMLQQARGWNYITRHMGRRVARPALPVQHESGSLSEFVTTSSGVQMPRILYTTALQKDGTEEQVQSAVRAGFLGFQTAGLPAHYNESGLGAALAELLDSGFVRDQLFVQTSVNPNYAAELNPGVPIAEQVKLAIANSLSNLRLECVDSLLLDLPYADHHQTMEAWQAMEDAMRMGMVRQLGISNVTSLVQLRRIYADATVKPAVVQEQFQVEAGLDQEIHNWCKEMGIFVQTFQTLAAEKRPSVAQTLQEISDRYDDVTPSMLFFRFLMGLGVVPLTAAFSRVDIKEDLSARHIPLASKDALLIDTALKQHIDAPDPEPEELMCFVNSGGESGRVTSLTGMDEFQAAQRCNGDRVVVYKFFAPWCRACKMTGIKIQKLAVDYPEMRFFEINYEANKELCKSLKIKALPSVEIYRGASGEKLDRFQCGPSKVPLLAEKLANYSTA